MTTSVVLRNVHKAYGTTEVIHGVNLTIEPGEFVVFVGPSGCGKSTLLRMVAGLETITSGDLFLGPVRMNDVPAARRGIAMVFQSYALYPHMSVYKNLAFGLETVRVPKAEIEARVRRAAEVLQIIPLLDRKPKQLSGGQRQRVAIGRAIVREPDIFLFDEPLSNLDAELRVQMRVELAKLQHKLGNTTIYVTHDQVEAMTMADRIVVLRSGVIEQVGTPLELYNTPDNVFVAGFIGSPKMNFLEGTIEGDGPEQTFVSGQLVVPLKFDTGLPPGSKISLGIRPEHISMDAVEGFIDLGTARTELVENLGGQTLAYVALADETPLTVLLQGQRSLAFGDSIRIGIDPQLLHVFGPDGRALRTAAPSIITLN